MRQMPASMLSITNPALSSHDIDLATNPTGLGKSLVLYRGYPTSSIAANEPVLTHKGPKAAQELDIQDLIISGTGEIAKISAISKNPAENVYLVTLKSGREIPCSANMLLVPSQDKNNNINAVVTAKDLHQYKQTHSGKLPAIYMPVNRPVKFNQTLVTPDINSKNLNRLADKKFNRPLPESWLYSDIAQRQKIIQFFVQHFAYADINWELDIQKEWHPDIKSQLNTILRSLGYNTRFMPAKRISTSTCVLKIFTCANLLKPNRPPIRVPAPMDYADQIVDIKLKNSQEPTICIAPEPGVYNYLLANFCVVHTTLYSYAFDKRMPRLPWGTDNKTQKSLRVLYPKHEPIHWRPERQKEK